MHSNSFIAAAIAAFRVVQADFMVYTEAPITTESMPKFTDAAEASGWTLSVDLAANRAYKSFTKELGSTYHSSQSSAASEIEAFVHSAHNYSIPNEVTDFHTTTTFFSKPDWYDAQPSAARAFKELQVLDQFSIVKSIIDAGTIKASSTASSTGAAVPTAQVFSDAKFGVMAAVAAAMFL